MCKEQKEIEGMYSSMQSLVIRMRVNEESLSGVIKIDMFPNKKQEVQA